MNIFTYKFGYMVGLVHRLKRVSYKLISVIYYNMMSYDTKQDNSKFYLSIVERLHVVFDFAQVNYLA